MNYERQSQIVTQSLISASSISLIGCGAIGSAVAMALAKMGVGNFVLYDEDGVSEVNLPNQFFFKDQVGAFKVDALSNIIEKLSDEVLVTAINRAYVDHGLEPITIVTTDSMISRKQVWLQFQQQTNARTLIEARMGAEEGQVYTIRKGCVHVQPDDVTFYEDRLYSDEQANHAPCTARAIIYNVFMIASLVCRAYKAVIHNEPFPREVVFGMSNIYKYSFQIRD
jgi:molybdopterin/thiamine biosynthesis adenylyltransferase